MTSAADVHGNAGLPATRNGRGWFHSIGGKLLIAFGLIAALTVGATSLSLVRFHQIDGILRSLVEVSIPALKLSQDVQNQAASVIDAANDVANAHEEVERHNLMAEATNRIAGLWLAVGKLDAVISDDATMTSIKLLIARIDSQVGDLNRTVGDSFTALRAVRGAIDKVKQATRAAEDAITAMIVHLNSPQAAPAQSADPHAEIRRIGGLLAELYDLRSHFRDATRVLSGLIAAGSNDDVNSGRTQFHAVFDPIRASVGKLKERPELPPARFGELAAAIQDLGTLATGSTGIFTLQDQVLRINASIAALAKALQGDGAQLREQVARVVATAEQQASEAERRSTDAINSSLGWLLAIAIASLAIAGLIVWLFVQRYVVARLYALSASMMAIARGNLSTPIPAAGPDELGDMSRALAVFRDNAREIHIARDEAIQARAEAETASHAKSSFLANMSHELRTPLNAIIGYSELLAEDAVDCGDDATVQDLGKIQAAGKHLLGLINSILDLSKIEAGRMDVYLEQVDLAQLVQEVEVIIRPLVESNRNRLSVDCPPDIGVMRTDLTKLKQSLINLLSNATKFTKDGEVRFSLARRAGPAGHSQVRFTVADTGIGMTSEQMGRLFEAFSQSDASTTRNFGGTGLGLAITKRFATMLGGTVGVTSEPGKGSTFTLELPDQAVRTAAAPDQAVSRDAAPAGAALTVLVVDDDPTVHEVLAATLGKRGYRVVHASDGAQALDVMRRSPPDVVTLDVMMPTVDGWTVLGNMKSDPALEHIPVIMLTIVDDRNLGYSLGAAEYMTKPVDRERLVSLVQRFTNMNKNAVVLIVDDDPDVRNVVRTTLRSEGLKTAEAVNGRAALDWMDANPAPDLVLLDLMMPVMDGFQFLDSVREHPDRLKIPVVVLTAKDLTAQEKAFLAERTILVLGKSAQPIGSLGAALAAIATQRQRAGAARASEHTAA